GIRDDLVTGVQTCALPIYRTVAGPDPPDGRQGGGAQARERAGCADGTWLARARGVARGRPAGRGGDRLPGHHQGGGRRRRQGDEIGRAAWREGAGRGEDGG